MNRNLVLKVSQGEERAAGIKSLLVFTVAAFYLAVVPGCVGTNELVADTQVSGSFLEKGLDIPFAVGKTVGKFKAVISLNALHTNALTGIPLHQPFQEVSRGVGGLLGISGQEAEPGELIYCGVLEQVQLRVGDAAAGNYLHIHLDTLAGVGHLLVRFRNVSFFLLFPGKHPQFSHHAEQALGPAGITTFLQATPKLQQTQVRIAAAHVPDQLQLRFCVLVWMAVGTPGLAGQGLHAPVPACLPEVDIGPAFVILPDGAADAIFLRIFH